VAFHLPPWPPPAGDVYLGYLMLTPGRHVVGFADLTEEESAAVGRCISRLSRAISTPLGAERDYLAVVGHGVPHLQIHLIPRWLGTPADVSCLHVDDWDGARRRYFAVAEVMAGQIRDGLDAPT
jgi:histidine triad (HIT) family protein